MTTLGPALAEGYRTGVEKEIPTTPSRSRAIILLIGFCFTIIAVIIVATGLLVFNARDRAFAENERELKNTALILAKQIDGSFQTLELLESSVGEHLRSAGIDSAVAFGERMAGAAAHLMLHDKASGLPPLDALVLVNADGDVINSSRDWPVTTLNIADRPYISALKSNPKLMSILSEPIRNRINGAWTVFLARKLVSSDGGIIGFALAGVQLSHFEDLFGALALHDGSSVSLVSNEGLLLARYPPTSLAIAQPLSHSLGALLQDSDSAVTRLTGTFDQIDRVVALQRLAHYPAFISAGTSADSILADLRNQLTVLICLRVLAAAFVVLAAVLISREVMRSLRAANGMLTRQKLHLNTALSNMSQGLLMTDAEGQIVLCNSRYLEMYKVPAEMVRRGCTRREILEHHFTAGVLSGNAEEYILEAFGGISQQASFTKTVQTSDGRTIAIINRAIEGGMRVSTHQDVTETRRAEEERDRSRQFLDCVLENVPVAIVVKSALDSRYILINRSAERLWGLVRERVIGRTTNDIWPKSNADKIAQWDRQLLEHSGTPLLIDKLSIETPNNGWRVVSSKGFCMRAGDGEPRYLIHVIEDVTDRVAMEDQLRHAQKMESIGCLTGGLAHDFNNLLTAIIGNLELMQIDFPDAAGQIAAILRASEQGSELTRQLLAFARKQPLRPNAVDVNELLEGTACFLAPALGETISVDLRMGPGLWTAVADRAQLQTAVMNIAINARDAMPNGGMLTIETRNVGLDHEYAARHAGISAGRYVLVEITDNGCGMEPDIVNRIFEPFFTTKPLGRGTGLGLSIVYGFMKQSGGHISVHSEVGRGTTLKLYLPLFEGEIEAAAVPEPAIGERRRSKEGAVILAVEDNAGVRTTVVRHLRDLGYVVREADSAHAAWRILDEDDTIDLLFTDIVMPGNINGKELATVAKQRYPHLKVLFTSGFPGGSLANVELLDAGDILLSKPYRKRVLKDLVGQVLMQ
jgi:PAS domain S-box-containing protein